MNRRKFLKQLAGLTVAIAGKLPPAVASADKTKLDTGSDFFIRQTRFYATRELLDDAALSNRVAVAVIACENWRGAA